jgi:hypothetical protein
LTLSRRNSYFRHARKKLGMVTQGSNRNDYLADNRER